MRLRLGVLFLPMVIAVIPDAFADVALLRNGRSLAVTDFRREGDRIVLMMEGGGQIALLHDQVVAIRRDEAADRGSRPAPVVPQASSDGTSMAPAPEPVLESGPQAGVKGLEEGPIEIGPGEVFDRQALRDLAARSAFR